MCTVWRAARSARYAWGSRTERDRVERTHDAWDSREYAASESQESTPREMHKLHEVREVHEVQWVKSEMTESRYLYRVMTLKKEYVRRWGHIFTDLARRCHLTLGRYPPSDSIATCLILTVRSPHAPKYTMTWCEVQKSPRLRSEGCALGCTKNQNREWYGSESNPPAGSKNGSGNRDCLNYSHCTC